jgi:Tfp pilus assembly protein FimT
MESGATGRTKLFSLWSRELVCHFRAASFASFTLVELLVCVAILFAMGLLMKPAWSAIAGAQNATTACYEIAGILHQARAYAMANNTHVFVGILEENAERPATDPAPRTGIGRVIIAAFASSDGTKGYDSALSWKDRYLNGGNLRPISNLRKFENLHVAATLGAPPPSGAMARPDVNYYYRLGHSSCSSVTPITWPIGSALDAGYQYRFDKVIRFDPLGTPRIQYKTNSNTIVLRMEIGLQQTHGNQWQGLPSSPNGGNQSAIQIDGITGATRIYRP